MLILVIQQNGDYDQHKCLNNIINFFDVDYSEKTKELSNTPIFEKNKELKEKYNL